jgi:hypothetical protein
MRRNGLASEGSAPLTTAATTRLNVFVILYCRLEIVAWADVPLAGRYGQGHGKVVKWGCELLFHSSG